MASLARNNAITYHCLPRHDLPSLSSPSQERSTHRLTRLTDPGAEQLQGPP